MFFVHYYVGYVFTRGGYVELSKKLSLPLGYTLDRYEILKLKVLIACSFQNVAVGRFLSLRICCVLNLAFAY